MTPLDFITDTIDHDRLLLSSVELAEDTGIADFDHDGYAALRSIQKAERHVPVIAESQGPLFTIKPRGPRYGGSFVVQPTTCGRRFLRLIINGTASIPAKFPKHSFPPEVEILAKVVQRFNLSELVLNEMTGSYAIKACEQLNAAVDYLRLSAMNLSTLRLQHTKASLKNQKGGFRWIDRIHAKYGRPFVLRLDLHINKKYELGASDPHAISLEEAFWQRAEFIRKLPRALNISLLGYMVKTEFTLRRSIHHHVLLVLDGNKHREHINLAMQAGKFWESTITNGRGTFHNINQHTDLGAVDCGIGEVHANDTQKILALKTKVIAYLCKPDYLARFVIPKRHRLFLKSIPALMTIPKRGRKRNPPQPAQAIVNTLHPGSSTPPPLPISLESEFSE